MASKKKKQDIPPIDTASLQETEAAFRERNLQETARRLSIPQGEQSPFSYTPKTMSLDMSGLNELQDQLNENARRSFVVGELQQQEIPGPRLIGEGFEESIAEKQNLISQNHNETNKFVTETQVKGDVKDGEEKYGVKTFFTKSPSEISSLLGERICNVEFTRSTVPRGKRVLRCTLNPQYIPGGKGGFGNMGGLVKVWDVELNDYRSFYASTVSKISYDDTPGQPS
jgi:hypothetical protein